MKKVGVLTGGGDCPGLNAVIRAVVKSASVKHEYKVTGIEDGFEGLVLPNKTRDLTLQNIRGILPIGGTILGTTNRANPFEYKIIIDGKSETRDISRDVLNNIQSMGLDALIVIGGDGTLKIAYELFKQGCPVVGVPKTIDNDILATDVTFGFRTAVQTATDALDRLHTTAESHHRVMVVEVMGRYVGWIALETGIGGGADVILIPEIPFDMEAVCKKIDERKNSGSRSSIVVVAEGAKPIGGDISILCPAEEGGSAERLGGIGNKVGANISCYGREVRVTVLGHLQRGGTPCAFDRILSTQFGVAAMDLVAHKRFGEMVCLRGKSINSVSLNEVTQGQKKVPTEEGLVKVAESIGISFGR
ncbi:6-phosphofructokinase 1 [Candidatus Brocadiaceae bacterium B188]|nr:ATP-dependent 6-phosphofructokinase [Candidatus Brocadia sapporoensis]QQR66602.1 MAG: ATP-dependent 6-phosphofructokinase [Candidatus Brocadia sp.]RZV59428.1 MAG: ATP-dependent 6-phosphofructokinase [Candidatus Brocadia sp. BROELEC01]TWU53565.1 6-phosphofructokinase 1 [Candidatus Brocadiaceae bacterium B188]